MTRRTSLFIYLLVITACSQAPDGDGQVAVQRAVSNLVNTAGDMWVMNPEGGSVQSYPKGFNLFVFEDVSGLSHTQGAVGAGGDVSAQSFGINNVSFSTAGLVAGEDVNLQNGAVTGDLHYGGGASLPQSVNITGDVLNDDPIDFDDARSQLIQMSALLTQYGANGTTSVYSWGGVAFSGSDDTLNIFEVESDALNATNSIWFEAPAGSVVVVNVTGETVDMSNMGISLGGLSLSNVLWNFPQTTSLSLRSISFKGSGLAPLADVEGYWGNFEGTLVAKSFTGPMEFHDVPFEGHSRLTISSYQLVSPGGPLEDTPWEQPENFLSIGEQNVRFTWYPDDNAVSYNLVVLVPSRHYSVFYREVCVVENLSVGNGLTEENGMLSYEFTGDDCPTTDLYYNYWPGEMEHAWYVENVEAGGAITPSEWFRYYLDCADTLNVPSEYATIQQAVDAAGNCACVVVADGVYSGPGNKDIQWNGDAKHLWIRSANGASGCVIDVGGNGRGFDLTHGQNRQDIIQGFTIQNGWAILPPDQPGPDYDTRGGGAIRCDGTSPQILHNVFFNNVAGNTEGIVDVSFLADGGAIYVGNDANPVIHGNIIEGNYASHTGGGIGVHNAGGSIENNFIINNMNRGCYGGGGISLAGANTDNGAPLTEIVNNLIAGNSSEFYAHLPDHCSGGYGGGIISANSNPNIINNTIVGNTTALRDPDSCPNPDMKPLGEGGGIRIRGLPTPIIANNIIRDNISSAGFESLDFQDIDAVLDVSYCNIEGGVGDIDVTRPETIIDADPHFIDPTSWNYDLLPTSPCIDSGTPDWPVSMRHRDLGLKPRSRGSAIDIGAYEFFQ